MPMNRKTFMAAVALSALIILAALPMSQLFSAQVVSSANADSVNDWPMFRHDASHTGFSESATPTTSSPQQLWNYTADVTATYALDAYFPVIFGGFVYVATADEEQGLYGVSCLESSTGAVVWSLLVEGFPFNSPAVDGNRVYVGSGYPWKTTEGYIYCLDASNGVQVWNSSVAEPMYSPVTFADGRVFIESNKGNLYCLDAANGNKVWNYSTGGKANLGSCPAVADGKVFVGNDDGNVFCLDAAYGAVIWNFTAYGYVSSPAVAHGYVYFGSADGNAYCINASSGDKVWNYTTWFNTAGPAHNYQWGNMVGGAAVAYGHVYVGSSDFDVFCLDAFTGKKVWNVTTGAGVRPPTVANGCVYVCSSDGNLYCLNASSGIEYWRYALEPFSSINSGLVSPVIANGEVYVMSRQEPSGIILSDHGVIIVLGLPSGVSAFPLVWIAPVVGVMIIVVAVVAYLLLGRKSARIRRKTGS